MRKFLVLAALACTLPLHAATLELEVSGLEAKEGAVMVALFNQAEGWLKKPVKGVKAQPTPDGKAVLRFEDLPEGDYAISLYHDVNGNGKMDTNVMGIPTEPYAFSNGAFGSFGPPSFDAARFSVKGDAVHRIAIR